MVSKNVVLFPEVLATLTFLPLGVYMGFISHFYFINVAASRILYVSEQWPHVVSAACAILTSLLFLLGRPNQSTNRYRFEHFYILMFGMFFVMLGGIILVSAESPYAGIYIIFAGKGICYVAALSYLNIRMGKSRYRMLKLSLPHWVYLLGVAIGATVTTTSTDQPYSMANHYDDVIQLTSILIIVMAVALLCGYLTNELLHRQKKLDYKRSLDNDINRENEQGQIFRNKYFLITQPRSEAQLENIINTKIEWNAVKEVFYIILAVVGKIGGVAYFYAPFIYMNLLGAIFGDKQAVSYFVLNWYGMIGITASLILLCWGTYKHHFLFSCGIKMFALLISLTFLVWDDFFETTKTVMSILYVVLAFGYGYCDINILSYANLKYNEIILALGYSAQYITIGVIQYYTIFLSNYVLDFTSSFSLMFPHFITFGALFTFVAIVAIFLLPNRTQLSLLEIKNVINRKSNIEHATHFTVVHPNCDLPPPYVLHPAHPYENLQPSEAHMTVHQGLQEVLPGTNYPQYYPPPQYYAQQQMQPHYYPQQSPTFLDYGHTPAHPGTPPPNYCEYPSQMTAHNNKITEL